MTRLLAGATVEDVNARERMAGQTALMWALAERHLDVVRVLTEHGADVHSGSASGFTPLMFAARHGDLDAVQLLLSRGADVNRAAKDGVTSLHVATVRGHVEVAEYLLEAGANPNATGPGYTVLHWAVFTSETFMSRDYNVETGEWAVLAGLPTRESKARMVRAAGQRGRRQRAPHRPAAARARPQLC